jgi:LacI family transcriptional regulator
MNIEEVAKAAGVSKSTVYKVLQNRTDISPQTAKIIQRVIRDSGFIPRFYKKNHNEDSKAALKGSICVSFYETRQNVPLTARLLHGFARGLSERRLNMMLTQFDGTGDVPGCIQRRQVDGVIVRPGTFGKEISARLDDLVPSVWLFEKRRDYHPDNADIVCPDDEMVGNEAARYLVGRGHKSLAVLNPWPVHPHTLERIDAFVKGAADSSTGVTTFAQEQNIAQLVDQLCTMPGMPTGVYLGGNNDEVVFLYHTLIQKGIQPGRDIDLVCCVNDQQSIEKQRYVLANIDIQPEQIAQVAIETLTWRLENPSNPRRRVLVEPRLITPDIV